jgi:hypothetical protein
LFAIEDGPNGDLTPVVDFRLCEKGCTPAPLPEPSSDPNKGDILIEVNQGTF